jgi:hypothetical protein
MKILQRLREPSTWAGLGTIAALLAVFGVNIPAAVFTLGPQLVGTVTDLLIAFGIGAGAAAVALPERAASPPPDAEL